MSQSREFTPTFKTHRLPISENPSIRKFFPEEDSEITQEPSTIVETSNWVEDKAIILTDSNPVPSADQHDTSDLPPPDQLHVNGGEGFPEEAPHRSASGREEVYKIVGQVGEGTFGKVYKAQNLLSQAFVALKRLRMEGERDGFPVTAMREIKLLQCLHHLNIVQLHEMIVSKGITQFSYKVIFLIYPLKATFIWSLNIWTMI